MFDGNWRRGVDQVVQPIGRNLHRAGVSPDMLTVAGLTMAAAAAVVIGAGWLEVGLVLFLAAAVPDLLDGQVAKAGGTSTTRGAFFDSTADRVTDSLLLGGIAWHLTSTRPGLLVMLPFAVMGTSFLISYQRAKAESLGLDARGGLMERAERILLLAFGLLFEVLLLPVLWLMLVLTSITAVQRFAKVWGQASQAPEIRARRQQRLALRPERRRRREQRAARRLARRRSR